jgi:hypothetical protein
MIVQSVAFLLGFNSVYIGRRNGKGDFGEALHGFQAFHLDDAIMHLAD